MGIRIALLAAAVLATGAQHAVAAGAYDDPKIGTAPCLFLNAYDVDTQGPPDAATYRAALELENMCGRSIEVSLCLLLAEPVDDSDRLCLDQIVRPWAVKEVEKGGLPARVTGTEYQWRYLPVAQ